MDILDPLIGALAAQLFNLVVTALHGARIRYFGSEGRLDVRITWRKGHPDDADSAP
jgi:hypothetical protein